jgi:class 3 adenylate cyclase
MLAEAVKWDSGPPRPLLCYSACRARARGVRNPEIEAILVSDVVGYSRLAGATLARLRALRSDPIDPTISVHRGWIVKRTGDGSVIEFRSVVAAVRCAGSVIIFAFY